MKRNLIIILSVAVAAVAAFIYFTRDDVTFSKETSLYKAVPLTSPVFFEYVSLKSIPSENPILQELSGISSFNKALNHVNKVQEAIKENAEIQNQLASRPVVLALDFIGKNILHPVFITSLKNTKEKEGFKRLVEDLSGVPVASFRQRNYDGKTITDVIDAQGTNKVSYSISGNLVILSSEAILVEKCLRQLGAAGITDNLYFNKVNKTVNAQSEISIYINHRRFPDLWGNFLSSVTRKEENEFGETIITNLKRDILGIKNYASWSELDLSFYENRLTFNGITTADDSLNHFLSVLKGQKAVSCNADRLLPKNTSFYIGFSFSNNELFFRNLEKYFVHSESYYSREEKIKKMEKYFRSGSREKLKSLAKNRVLAAITSIPANANKKTTLFIVNNDSRNENVAVFEELLSNYAKRKEIEFSSLVSVYQTSSGGHYRIYSFPYPSLPGIWLGKAFDFAKGNFAVFRDENLIFCNSKEGLQRYLNDMDAGSILKSDKAFAEFNRETENKANLNLFANTNRLFALSNQLFNKQLNKSLEVNKEIFRKFGFLSWQVVCEEDIYFNSVNIGCDFKPRKDAKALWQQDIGAELATKPQIVINHRNKSSKEIIVQDVNNKLHLIAADGKLIWSVPINGKIAGRIHQVDYYRNGKLQYLFNTKEKIYLIDRTGRMVANFPIVLKSSATNGVNVFDYDNNRKYRYFIACENRKVYAYNHEGKVISGWKFGQTAGIVSNPIQHFRVNNKDYIVFSDDKKVYIQNRRGETRVQSSAGFNPSKNGVTLNTNGVPKIVTTDTNGKVFYLFFDGKYAEKKTDNFSKDHSFTVDDINGDGSPEFVYTDGNKLYVFNEQGKKLFSEKFDNSLQYGVNLYAFSATKKLIGVTDAGENEIYLFQPSGKEYNGFPLDGNSEFSIGKLTNDGPLNLVVGSSDGEVLNYSLE